MATRSARRGWTGAVLIGVSFAVAMIGTTMPTPLYPRYEVTFGFGEFVTTVVFATYAVGVASGLLVFGHWSDQLGRRPMLLAGLALSALAAVAFALADASAWLFVGRFVSGLSAGIFTGTATAAVVDLAPSDADRPRAGLLAAAVNMGGLGLGPLLAGVLSQYGPAPLRLCWILDVVLVLGGAVAVLRARESVRRVARPALRPRRLQVPPATRPTFVRAAIAGFAGFAVLGLVTAVTPAFLGSVLGVTNGAVVGSIVLAVFAASVAGQVFVSRVGTHRSLWGGCVGLIVGMALLIVALLATSSPLLVAALVVAGLGQGMSFRAGLGSVTSESPDELRGEVTSTFFVTLYAGISLPVIGEGALATGIGLVDAGVVFAGLVGALVVASLVLLLRRA